MKRLIIPIIFLILTIQASAQKADLLILDDDIDASELKDSFHIKKGSTLKSFLPPKDKRDALLTNVPEAQNWDEYQKDSFYMDIKNKTPKEIKEKYPQLTNDEISKLKGKL